MKTAVPPSMTNPIMTRTGRATLAVLAIVAACATNGNHRDGGGQVAIRRGSAWATYSFKLPRIVGPSAELKFAEGTLTGMMASQGLKVQIGDGQATGFGPRGPVNLKITAQEGGVEVDGMWNAGPVHLVISPSMVRGSVVVGRGRTGAGEISCSYQLDRREPSGALVGSSACAGMPQEARLEVDAAVRNVLSPSELAVFLVAALASPPFAPHEWL
jgi:hypothetical protein